MLDNYEYEGYWWLPEDAVWPDGLPSDRSKMHSGTLTINRGDARLKILESFGHTELGRSENSVAFSPLPSPQPRILGLSSEGDCITLDHCGISDAPMHFPGIPTTVYRAGLVVIGAWFTEDEEMTFDEIALQTAELYAWAGVRGFKALRNSKSGVRATFEKPRPLEMSLRERGTMSIKFSTRFSGIPPAQTAVTFTQTPSLHLRPPEPLTIDGVTSAVGEIRNFVSLALGRPETVKSVLGYKDALLAPKSEHRQPMQIIYRLQHNPDPRERSTHPSEMLFTLSQYKRRMPKMLRTWLALQEQFEPVFNLYFGIIYHPDMYLDVQFLTYAQAIETYDFRRRDPFDLTKREHSKRVKSMLAKTPDAWREWLSRKLIDNYKTLDDRIRSVLDMCPEVSAKIVGASEEERDAFVKLFKDSRNWYTHYTPSLKKKAATSPGQLHYLVNQLRTIIEMSLLREIGFSSDEIDHMFSMRGGQRYFQLKHWKRVAEEDAG